MTQVVDINTVPVKRLNKLLSQAKQGWVRCMFLPTSVPGENVCVIKNQDGNLIEDTVNQTDCIPDFGFTIKYPNEPTGKECMNIWGQVKCKILELGETYAHIVTPQGFATTIKRNRLLSIEG